eukprot:6860476-Alexandrium_andersonii.AAC.1
MAFCFVPGVMPHATCNTASDSVYVYLRNHAGHNMVDARARGCPSGVACGWMAYRTGTWHTC